MDTKEIKEAQAVADTLHSHIPGGGDEIAYEYRRLKAVTAGMTPLDFYRAGRLWTMEKG